MKIHDANKDIIKQDKELKEKRSKHQSIENKYHPLETLSDVIQNKYHPTPQTKFTVRLDDELENTLRVYADEKGLTVPSSIRSICEKYFKDRWITRSFFHLDKPFTVAIPVAPQEIEKYIIDGIDCIIHLSHDIDTRLDVQSHLISKDETDKYLAVTFNVGNNYLDVYNKEFDCYCAGNLKDYHIGLFDVYLEHLAKSVFIRVTFQDKTPISARLINKYDAMQMCSNPMLIEYIKHIKQATSMDGFKKYFKEKETYIKTLEAHIETLENEISTLKDEVREHDARSQDLEQSQLIRDDTEDEVKENDSTYSMLPSETQKALTNAIMQVSKISAQYQQATKDIQSIVMDAKLNKYKTINNENKSDDANDDS